MGASNVGKRGRSPSWSFAKWVRLMKVKAVGMFLWKGGVACAPPGRFTNWVRHEETTEGGLGSADI